MDAPELSRRGFLAAIAAALAMKPEQLTGPPIPRFAELYTAPVSSRPRSLLFRPWRIIDTVDVWPGRETFAQLFVGPSPSNFLIRGVGWYVPPAVPSADLAAILDQLEMRLLVDSKTYLAAPLHVFGAFGGGLQVLVPEIAIASSGNFCLEVAGDACPLAAPTPILFHMEGVLAFQKPAAE